jgi:cysteine desulfurase
MNPTLYFDCAASSPVAEEALLTYMELSRTCHGNPSSIHGEGLKSRGKLESYRFEIASMLGIDPSETIFTSGATEANNTVFNGVKAKRIIISKIEHPSVREATLALANRGVKIESVNVLKNGRVDLDHFKKLLAQPVDLVSIMLVNNETGMRQPVEEAAELLKTTYPESVFHSDAVQGVSKDIWFKDLTNIDFFTLSAHKFHGPKGVGILMAKKELQPLLYGGGQEMGVRSGTEAVASIGALCVALKLSLVGRDSQFQERCSRFYSLLKSTIPKIKLNGDIEHKVPWIFNISFPDIRGAALGRALEQAGMMVSTSSACASGGKGISKILKEMGCTKERGHIRFSLSHFIDDETLKRGVDIISNVYGQYSL